MTDYMAAASLEQVESLRSEACGKCFLSAQGTPSAPWLNDIGGLEVCRNAVQTDSTQRKPSKGGNLRYVPNSQNPKIVR
jgi:hypothetical protein